MSHLDETDLLKKIDEVDRRFRVWRVFRTWKFVLGIIPVALFYTIGAWVVLVAGQLKDATLIVAMLALAIAILAFIIQWADFYFRQPKSSLIATNYRHLKKSRKGAPI